MRISDDFGHLDSLLGIFSLETPRLPPKTPKGPLRAGLRGVMLNSKGETYSKNVWKHLEITSVY